ncbi:C2orf81 [Bugula neritina]|uniref:C2orf81 n=1 Tax=Bugula neritina TaxID=10212 RepID=A0A7J7KB01_BUGNE|nr:C2orf81 [Bugula neritina]
MVITAMARLIKRNNKLDKNDLQAVSSALSTTPGFGDESLEYLSSLRFDMNRMLELDDGEDFISDLVEETVSNALSIIYDKYIERQLLPYTISQAKEALLTIIDWRFLACDLGEKDPSTDPTWQEDGEPSAAVPDCWAQGSVPKTIVKKRAPSVASLKEDSSREIHLDEEPKPWEISDEQLLADVEPAALVHEEAPLTNKPVEGYGVQVPPAGTIIPPPVPVPAPPPGSKTKNGRKKFRPKKGRLQSAGVSNMVESLEDTERKISTEERLRSIQGEQTEEDKSAKYNPMPKSVGSILKTKFFVIDPSVEAAQARLNAMRTGRYTASKPQKGPIPISDKTKLDKTSILDYRSVNSHAMMSGRLNQGGTRGGTSVTPLPPPMIESMELAPGVIIREGDRVKRGPKQLRRTADKLPRKEALRPVCIEPEMTISVQELLGNKEPLVRIEPTPVPPIIGKHDMNNAHKVVTS